MSPSAPTAVLAVRFTLPFSLAFNFRFRLVQSLPVVVLLFPVQLGSQFADEAPEQAATGLFQRLQGP